MEKPLSNVDIMKYVERMKIPYFRGVFMRDALPKKPNKIECMILNHDSKYNGGTHWTALVKVDRKAYYFDSFGKLPPPHELARYLGSTTQIHYNYNQYQGFDSVICGHLCLKFLYDFWHRNRNINIDHISD